MLVLHTLVFQVFIKSNIFTFVLSTWPDIEQFAEVLAISEFL